MSFKLRSFLLLVALGALFVDFAPEESEEQQNFVSLLQGLHKTLRSRLDVAVKNYVDRLKGRLGRTKGEVFMWCDDPRFLDLVLSAALFGRKSMDFSHFI